MSAGLNVFVFLTCVSADYWSLSVFHVHYHPHFYVCVCLFPPAECVRELPCGDGFLGADRQGDWKPGGGSERCHGGGTCVEGETPPPFFLFSLLAWRKTHKMSLFISFLLKQSYRASNYITLVILVLFKVRKSFYNTVNNSSPPPSSEIKCESR